MEQAEYEEEYFPPCSLVGDLQPKTRGPGETYEKLE